MNAVVQHSGSVLIDMASRYGMDPNHFELTVRATCSPKGKDARPLTREEFAAFLLVAREHRLNPLLKEIYAFPSKHGGGIVPVVSVDGWINLVNSHPAFDGMEFVEEHNEQGGLVSTECCLWRKDRGRPTKVREHLKECWRDTDPWKMPHRMLRHKALIQTARYAFGFAGIYDEEEAAVIAEARDVTPVKRTPPPAPTRQIEHIDPETGEVTEITSSTVDPQTVEGRKEGQRTATKAAPSSDVSGAGLDSHAAAHQGSPAEAASSGSPTNVHGTGDRTSTVQQGARVFDSDDATKAFMSYARDLGAASEGDEAEAIRDGYLTQWAMAWTREQKEQAAHLYSIAMTRIEAAEAEAARDEAEGDFPGDSPAPQGEPLEPAELKKERKPPKAPAPAQEAPKAAKKEFNPATDHPVNAAQYRAVFDAKFKAITSLDGAKTLKSWWFSSSSLRNSCGCSDADKEEMRNIWLAKLDEMQGRYEG